MKKDVSQIINLILESDISYLITISGETATATIFSDTDETNDEIQESLVEAFWDCWFAENQHVDDGEPVPFSRFLYETDPNSCDCEEGCCDECQKKQEDEIKLAQQN